MEQPKSNIIQAEDIKLLAKIFTKNWLFFILIPLIAAVFSYLYAHRLVDLYQARVQVILKSNEYDFANTFKDYYTSYESTANQIRVVKSSNIIEEVVERLHLNVSYFIVGRIKTTEVYHDMPFTVKVDQFSGGYGIPFIINVIDTSKYLLKYEFNGENIEKEYRFNEYVLDNNFNFFVEKNINLNQTRAQMLRKADYMFIIRTNDELINKYKSQLFVENEEWTSILTVSLNDEIPQRAIAFLDTLAKVYIDFSLQNKIQINKNSYDYIDKQLDEVVDIINSIEKELEIYKESKSILNIDREEVDFYQKLIDAETELKTIERRIQSIVDLKKYLLESKDERFLPPSFYILGDDQFIQNSINQLYVFQNKKNESLLEGTEKMFSIAKIDKNIQETKKDLLTHIINSETYLKTKFKSIQDEITTYEGKLKNIPQKQRQLLNIERKLQVNEKLYLYLLEKRAENLIGKASIFPETKVIEKPRSFGIVWPNRNKIMLTYIGISFAIALLFALIRTLYFEKITNLEDLGSLTDIPVLGGIPQNSTVDGYLKVDQPKSVTTESFRNIRANLQYFFVDQPKKCKIIMVTSIYPGEGKTFCSLNLAAIIAKANKKVLIIDFDMHKPRVHKGLNMDKEMGLSKYLIDKQSLEDIIYKTHIESLDAIFSGPVPPNASELVLSEKVKNMIEHLKTIYEYIIIDTPPLSMISDGLALLQYTDAVNFVMNTQYASRPGLKFLKDVQRKNPKVKAGIILNGIKNRSWRYYYGKYTYKYGYGYGGYGYGYGYVEKEE